MKMDQKAYFTGKSKKGPQISETEKETDTKQEVRGLNPCPLFYFKNVEQRTPTTAGPQLHPPTEYRPMRQQRSK